MSIETKICCRCGEEKPMSRFPIRKDRNNRRRGTCLDCFAKTTHLYKLKNKEKDALQHKEYHTSPEIKNKRYRQATLRRKERLKTDAEYRKWYYSRMIKRRRERRKESVIYNLRIKMSRLIGKILNSKKGHRSWQLLVGYNAEDLKKHLESKFSEGMTWDNYGKWHIDHIIPQSVFDFNSPEDPEFKACWSLKNLQPLWAMDNIRKSNKPNEFDFACPHCGQTYSAPEEMANQSLECHKCHEAMRIPRPTRGYFAAPSEPQIEEAELYGIHVEDGMHRGQLKELITKAQSDRSPEANERDATAPAATIPRNTPGDGIGHAPDTPTHTKHLRS